MKTIIHVNQHVVKANTKNGTNDPVLTIKTYKTNNYAHAVEIKGPSKIMYSPDKPLSCGAKVWVETQAPVEVIA
jgi:hypothetical protein